MFNKKFNFWLVIVSLILGVVFLTANSVIAQEEITLNFWLNQDYSEKINNFLADAAQEYSENNENITIETSVQLLDRERVSTAISGNRTPDMMIFWHNSPWFWGVGPFYNLEEFVNDKEIGIDPNLVPEGPRKTAQYGGKVYALPLWNDAAGIVYNKKLWREAGLTEEDIPETWEEFIEVAQKLTVWPDEENPDDPIRWGLMANSIDWHVQQLVLGNGCDWVAEDLSTYLPDYGTGHVKEAYQMLYDMVYKYKIMPAPRGASWVGATDLTIDEYAFPDERTAMMGMDSASGMFETYVNDHNMDPENIGYIPTPQGPNGDPDNPLEGTGMNGIHVFENSEHPKEAYLFAKWFFENKLKDFALETNQLVPANVSLLDDPEITNHPVLPDMLEWISKAELRSHHNFPGRMDVRSEETAVAEAILLEVKTVDEALADFKDHADSVFEEYEEEQQEFLEQTGVLW